MAKEKDSFIVYYDWRNYLKMLSLEQKGVLLDAMFAYEIEGREYTGDDIAVAMAMINIQGAMDRNKIKYRERCEKNRKNIEKRWGSDTKHTTGTSRIRPYTKHTDHEHDPDPDHEHDHEHDPDPDHEREHDNDHDSGPPDWRAAPPDIDAVDDYICQHGLRVDVNEFFFYYQDLNWHTASGAPINWPRKLQEWHESSLEHGWPAGLEDWK
ncbi:MAG: hypothetical protein IJD21_03105 [Oscillospiraceae bacterium]|nr:hypothetical protein [Oscillospiraceae bacterium]